MMKWEKLPSREERLEYVKEFFSSLLKPLRGTERSDWMKATIGGFTGYFVSMFLIGVPLSTSADILSHVFNTDQRFIHAATFAGINGIAMFWGYHTAMYAGYHQLDK